jgi:hypothetical protein
MCSLFDWSLRLLELHSVAFPDWSNIRIVYIEDNFFSDSSRGCIGPHIAACKIKMAPSKYTSWTLYKWPYMQVFDTSLSPAVTLLWHKQLSAIYRRYFVRDRCAVPADPNPECRLCWGLIEFIDVRYILYSQSCWYFQPLLWTSAPLTFSLVRLPPPPHIQCINKYTGLYSTIHTVCNGVGERMGGLRQINTCSQVPLLVNF